jgi:hypothetical protein
MLSAEDKQREAWAAADSVDTDLSFSRFLELHRAEISQCRVPARRVVAGGNYLFMGSDAGGHRAAAI